MLPSTRERFAELAARPDDAIDLATGALLIAQEEFPDLSIDRYLGRLDGLALGAERRIANRTSPFEIVAALNEYLFFELNFHGNDAEYYDPLNSFLNIVLDRRLGIPITLAVVYIEIGRRLGLALEGVGFPGHFLVRYASGGYDLLIDPFHRGKVLQPEDLVARLRHVYGALVPVQPRFLASVSNRHILARMLNNLKINYLHRRDFPRARAAVERLLLLYPNNPSYQRDLAAIHAELQQR